MTGSPSSPKAASPKATSPKAKSPKSASSKAASPIPEHQVPEEILPSSHWAQAPLVDDDNDDAESAIGSDAQSSTASITSSVLAYRTINGRTYHAERGTANYWAANDDQQLDSMDIYAHLCYLMMDEKLFLAPLDKSTCKTALDVGTGTGVWAIDFADQFPDCEVIGTDISPIQATWLPPNLRFEIEDCTQEWTFGEDRFDYVHMRLLYGSIGDWDALFANAYNACKPGGWIESFDASPMAYCDDDTLPKESALAQWGHFYVQAGRKIDRTFEVLENNLQVKAMEKLGMVDIQVFDFKCPVNPWAKDPKLKNIGMTAQAVVEQDIEGYVSVVSNIVAGWGKPEVTIYSAHMRKDLRNTKYHAYWRFRGVWGRKPEKA